MRESGLASGLASVDERKFGQPAAECSRTTTNMPSSIRVALLAIGLLVATVAGAEDSKPSVAERWRSFAEQFRDPVDGQFDASAFLESAYGFLPVPIIVTEPAVGYGGGFVPVYLRPRHQAGSEGYARPDISAVGVLATENGTRMAFAGDITRWMDGRLRTLVGAVGGDINLDVYGLGNLDAHLDEPVRYTLDIKAAATQVEWNLAPKSPWSLGLRFIYADVVPKLRDDPIFPNLEDRIRTTIAGPGVAVTFDTRDNIFTPTRGVYSETSLFASDEAFGANRDFRRFAQIVIGYWPATPSLTLAARADYQQSSDGAPFFARPFIMMRGIPAMRYPGNKVAQTEVEARWQFHGRWSALVFGGVGLARIDEGRVQRDKTAGAGGIGFRYELARKFGLHAGIDVARGPEETAVYLQFGSAWMRP
jgi:hypothetical protein